MDKARDNALEEGKRLAKNHPVLKALRAIRGDFSDLTPEQKINLTRPDDAPYRILGSDIDAILGPGNAEAMKEKLGPAITTDPKKAIDIRQLAQTLGFEDTPQGLAQKNLLWEIRETPDEKTFVERAAQASLGFGGPGPGSHVGVSCSRVPPR